MLGELTLCSECSQLFALTKTWHVMTNFTSLLWAKFMKLRQLGYNFSALF